MNDVVAWFTYEHRGKCYRLIADQHGDNYQLNLYDVEDGWVHEFSTDGTRVGAQTTVVLLAMNDARILRNMIDDNFA